MNNLQEFEAFVAQHQSSDFRDHNTLFVIALGLAGEAGEACDLIKKEERDGKEIGSELLLELGDVLHYVAAIAQYYEFSLDEIMRANMDKLVARHVKKKGEGDE